MSSLVSSSASLSVSTMDSKSCDSSFDVKVREVGGDKIIKGKNKSNKMGSFIMKNKKKSRIGLKVSIRRSKKKDDPACNGSDTLETSKGYSEESSVVKKPIHDDAKNICIGHESNVDKLSTESNVPTENVQKEDKIGNARQKSIDYPSSPCNSHSTCDVSCSSSSSAETSPEVEKRRLESGDTNIIDGLEKIAFTQDSEDISLLSTDGGSVPAVWAQLVAQSPKISSMITSSDEEDMPSDLYLRYDTLTIRGIVQFCHSGNVDMSLYSSRECAARSLVWLVAASHCYEIRGLETKARNRIHELLSEWRPIACTVLDAAIATEDRVTRDLASLAMMIIRANPRAVLLGPSDSNKNSEGGGVKSVSMAGLCAILNDSKLYDEAIVMFHSLRLWAETDTKASADQGGVHQNEKINRIIAARKMIKKIQLSHMPPTELEKGVRESGLVTTAQLTDAYRAWARAVLENEHKWKSLSSLDSPLRRDKRGGIVIVRVAGINEVNGVYVASSKKSVMIYSKVGTWEGRRVRFHLYRAKQNWHLGLPDLDTPVEFYCAPLRSDDVHIPPNNSWSVPNNTKLHCKGIGPPPSCVWISESPNLDDL